MRYGPGRPVSATRPHKHRLTLPRIGRTIRVPARSVQVNIRPKGGLFAPDGCCEALHLDTLDGTNNVNARQW